ncbi:hypothetical protein IQ22_02659 [Pseudomonas duriflava]|uniref:Uncharacterized protein n=1 Tax=Pseudomonas duriflava TaxID=459528 RepID=A0A562Q9Q7_9PSED|nr:hypothetical protein IQ22_02659 [Pseudomonas duriflava]
MPMGSTDEARWLPMVGVLGTVPLILVWLIGLLVACLRWRIHRRSSMLCLISMVVLLLWLVIQTCLTLMLPVLLPLWQVDLAPGWAFALLNALGNLITAGCYALLLWAIFTGRNSHRSA